MTMTGIAVDYKKKATNLAAPATFTEDAALNLTDIVVSDVDSATVTATLTLSNPSVCSLSSATACTVASTLESGRVLCRASGAIADVNTLLAGVIFNPTLTSTPTSPSTPA